MPTLLLIRHGENDYVKTGKMAGRIPGVHLNEKGQKQARALADALTHIPLKAVYSSPLERAMETAQPIAESHKLTILQEPDLMDTDIGKWQGKSLKMLRLTKVWKIVQNSPSRFRFPEGESFARTREVPFCAQYLRALDVFATCLIPDHLLSRLRLRIRCLIHKTASPKQHTIASPCLL